MNEDVFDPSELEDNETGLEGPEKITKEYPNQNMGQLNTGDMFIVQINHTHFPFIDNIKLSEEVISTMEERIGSQVFEPAFERNPLDRTEHDEVDNLIHYIDEYLYEYGLIVDQYWGQVNRKNESTDYHNHLTNQGDANPYSFVYYSQVSKDCGDLILKLNDYTVPVNIHPQPGLLLLIPNWLDHKVSKNLSDDYRVSVSGILAVK